MKRIALYGLGLVCCLSLQACTSSTRGTVNQVNNSGPQVSPTLVQPQEMGLKRVVAISRFTDESKRANSFLVDNQGNKLGKQAADILAARLTDTNKFIMLERDAIEQVKQEGALEDDFNQVGADYLIVGSISEFGRSTTSEVGVFSRNKIQIANATVNVRLINTKNGQIIYSEEGSGEARSEANRVFGVGETAAYDTSLDDKAISAALSKLVSNIIEKLSDSPWQAYLVAKEGNQLMMTGGQSQGVKIGETFSILVRGKQMKNPQTGMMIELPAREVGKLTVQAFTGKGENELSLCELVSGNIDSSDLTQYVIREIE
ncbi:CsgG/HfaB family protein [Bowmanella sp. JS7-9]|uniref:Curli production assembly/transport component CsgG n=1 Tax=Pseudobowmanella zhangzhouensis TaxID=1537679 RepID=A0ABW1XNV2_9ALTE|nr:CsgG/HfaB family protein [Bowmanella sp. JS7-9]TBX20400.1 curli production assembly protein CsgG [Bowmanella sp. JS7-9]